MTTILINNNIIWFARNFLFFVFFCVIMNNAVMRNSIELRCIVSHCGLMLFFVFLLNSDNTQRENSKSYVTSIRYIQYNTIYLVQVRATCLINDYNQWMNESSKTVWCSCLLVALFVIFFFFFSSEKYINEISTNSWRHDIVQHTTHTQIIIINNNNKWVTRAHDIDIDTYITDWDKWI